MTPLKISLDLGPQLETIRYILLNVFLLQQIFIKAGGLWFQTFLDGIWLEWLAESPDSTQPITQTITQTIIHLSKLRQLSFCCCFNF